MKEVEKVTNQSLREYLNQIRKENMRNMVNITKDLERYPYNNTCFAVTGSDGKLERHMQSRTEIIIIYKNSHSSEGVSKNFSKWYEITHNRPSEDLYIVDKDRKLPELKNIYGNVPLSYFCGNKEIIYPDRILNAIPVYGNQELLRIAKEKVLEESSSETKLGQEIRKKMKAQLKDYRHNLEKGIFHHNLTFDLSIIPPLQFYDESKESYTVGFKSSGLRSVQRELDLLTIHAIRSKALTINDAASLPTNTVDRIDKFKKNNIIPNELQIDDSYIWFLRNYHSLQEKYGRNKSRAAVPFSKDEFIQNRQTILKFLDLSRGSPL